MSQQPQSFENHAKIVPLYHYFLTFALLVNFGVAAWQLYQAPGIATANSLLLAVALMVMMAYLRLFPLTVQDRLIRLEMKLRLREILPPDLYARVDEIRRYQFVALRFAPDAELPDLVRRVLAGELKTPKAIKQAIKTWNADHLRC